MSNILFANNASTVLAAPISDSATSCTVTTGSGALFPNPTGGQYFVMTFVDAATGLLTEIVHVTARSGDTLTIQRAQEDTTALSWLAGDIAANFWTAGSVTALQAGFPVGTETISSNTTLSISDAGNFIRVLGGANITLPSAATVSGMAVGVFANADFVFSIASGGGVFQGGAANNLTSITVAHQKFVCVQSNGTSWFIFSASPEILEGGDIATESWVSANFDPLGSAATAQTNAENFAAALQGNYPGTRSVTASTTFTSADFGYALRLGQSAVGNSAFTLPAPVVGASNWVENVSTFNLTVRCGTANQFYGLLSSSYAVPSSAQTSFVLSGPGSALIIGTPGGWAVIYNSQSFDLFGSAISAQAAAQAYALALAGNTLGYTVISDAGYEIVASDFGKRIALAGPTAMRTFSVDDGSGIAAGNAFVRILSPSTAFPLNIRVKPGSSAQFVSLFPAMNNVTSFQITNAEVWLEWVNGNWRATYATTAFLQTANNGSDIPNAATFRSNIGLGTAATHAATDFDTAGAAATAQSNAESYADSGGFGRSIANHAGGHVLGTTYTNTRPGAKIVMVQSRSSADADNLTPTVDGVGLPAMGQQLHGTVASVVFVVPPGSTYGVNWQVGTGSGNVWTEAYA